VLPPNTHRTRVHRTLNIRRLHTPATATAPPAPAVFSVGISRTIWVKGAQIGFLD